MSTRRDTKTHPNMCGHKGISMHVYEFTVFILFVVLFIFFIEFYGTGDLGQGGGKHLALL